MPQPAENSTILYRDLRLQMRAVDGEADSIEFTASSETPVTRWGDTEILSHKDGAVRLERLRTLGAVLVNHDPNQRAAAITSAEVRSGQLVIRAKFGTSDAAKQFRADVTDGLLRGVSVGYRVHAWDVNEDTSTYTGSDWEPYEASFTPIPADASVGVGRADAAISWRSAIPQKSKPLATRSATPEPVMPDPIKPEAAPVIPVPANDEAVRAAVIAETREVDALARSVGLDASPYLGMRKAEAQAKMIADLASKRGTATEPEAPAVRITMDQADKARDAFISATMHRVGFKQDAKVIAGNPMVGRTILDQARAYLAMVGVRGSQNWSRQDLANFVLGRTNEITGFRDGAANISVASFPSFVMLNAISKSVAAGFEMGSSSIKYQPLVSNKTVPDFKSFYIGGLGTGNFQKTAENIAFPELAKTEGAYNDTVKMWGGTLSLSLQALINDDVGEFDRSLRSAGVLAQKTIDRRVFQKLLMGTSAVEATSTWTSNTTSGCTPVWTTADTLAAARANVGKATAAMMVKGGLDGNPLGNTPRFHVAGPTAGLYLSGLNQPVGGQAVGNGGQVMPTLIVTPWLEAAALTGYSTTTYYGVSDPDEVTGLVLTTIAGMETPQVQEFDAGAVAARNWKLFLPFEADLFWYTGTDASTKVIPGAQQATT